LPREVSSVDVSPESRLVACRILVHAFKVVDGGVALVVLHEQHGEHAHEVVAHAPRRQARGVENVAGEAKLTAATGVVKKDDHGRKAGGRAAAVAHG
jgi:hypothetical protein